MHSQKLFAMFECKLTSCRVSWAYHRSCCFNVFAWHSRRMRKDGTCRPTHSKCDLGIRSKKEICRSCWRWIVPLPELPDHDSVIFCDCSVPHKKLLCPSISTGILFHVVLLWTRWSATTGRVRRRGSFSNSNVCFGSHTALRALSLGWLGNFWKQHYYDVLKIDLSNQLAFRKLNCNDNHNRQSINEFGK